MKKFKKQYDIKKKKIIYSCPECGNPVREKNEMNVIYGICDTCKAVHPMESIWKAHKSQCPFCGKTLTGYNIMDREVPPKKLRHFRCVNQGCPCIGKIINSVELLEVYDYTFFERVKRERIEILRRQEKQ